MSNWTNAHAPQLSPVYRCVLVCVARSWGLCVQSGSPAVRGFPFVGIGSGNGRLIRREWSTCFALSHLSAISLTLSSISIFYLNHCESPRSCASRATTRKLTSFHLPWRQSLVHVVLPHRSATIISTQSLSSRGLCRKNNTTRPKP